MTQEELRLEETRKKRAHWQRWGPYLSERAWGTVRKDYSPHGIRAVSRVHREHPYVLSANGMEYRVNYEPGESSTGLFGGNSNWRGPIWFPVDYLLIESLQKFHHYLGDDFKVECPTGPGQMMTLWEVAAELSRRMTRIFLKGDDGARPVHGANRVFREDPNWSDLVLFYEYFHGDTGAGVGASHQTGWTGLVAKLLQQSGEPMPEVRASREEKPRIRVRVKAPQLENVPGD